MYRSYINHFFTFSHSNKDSSNFSQAQVDSYFNGLQSNKLKFDKESKSKKNTRIIALRFLLNECLECNITFDKAWNVSKKKDINPHIAIDNVQLDALLKKTTTSDPEMNLLFELLLAFAARVQDVIQLKYEDILHAPMITNGIHK